MRAWMTATGLSVLVTTAAHARAKVTMILPPHGQRVRHREYPDDGNAGSGGRRPRLARRAGSGGARPGGRSSACACLLSPRLGYLDGVTLTIAYAGEPGKGCDTARRPRSWKDAR